MPKPTPDDLPHARTHVDLCGCTEAVYLRAVIEVTATLLREAGREPGWQRGLALAQLERALKLTERGTRRG